MNSPTIQNHSFKIRDCINQYTVNISALCPCLFFILINKYGSVAQILFVKTLFIPTTNSGNKMFPILEDKTEKMGILSGRYRK